MPSTFSRVAHLAAAGAALTLAAWLSTPVAAQALTEEARRADLAVYRSAFFERDRAYAPAARAEAERRLAALEVRLADVDPTRFALELAQVAALADNGHTLSFGGPRLARTNRVALRLAPFGQDFHVLRARTAHAQLLGARLRAIDGVPLARLREAAHGLIGGPPAWRDRHAPLLLESPQQLHALGLIPARDAASYRFETLDGRTVELRLVAEPPAADRPVADTERLLLPDVIPPRTGDVDSGWRGLLAADAAPWALREPSRAFRWRHLPELDAMVVEMRQTVPARDHTLKDFYAEVGDALQRHAPKHLVLDLRLNGGGDLTQARDFAESLPTRVPGRLFVLTSPWTFSAAISVTGYVKQAAPSRVTIVGEEAGDRLEFFAEGRVVTLPHSGEVLLPATERHDYRDGCRRFDDCHAPVVKRPIAIATLMPELPAPWTIEAYRRGEDPAMAAVAAALQAR